MAAALIPLQVLVGDLHGLNTLEHQPAKIAAMEGIWQTEQGAALRLFAIPDEAARTNHAEIAIPKLASLILTHSTDGVVKGLDEFRGAHPPVAPVFYSFRVMIGVGMLMWAISWTALWFWRRRQGELPKPLLWALVMMSFSGWVATLAGWYVTEIGRQPYLVYGVLRTSDAASTVPAGMIGISLSLYLSVYALLLFAYIRVLFLLASKARAPELNPAPGALPGALA